MPAPDRGCTLFLPALFSAAPTPVAVPVLETVLARGRALPALSPGFESTLFELFGLPTGVSSAAVTRLGEATPPEPNKAWMRADPVYFQLDGARMRLLGPMPLHLTTVEAQALAHELGPLFDDVPARIEMLHPERWYLALDAVPRLETGTLAAVLGGDVDTHLPRGADASAWRRRMNEVQMVLHASHVNVVREARGELPVNSLWFWGAGRAPAPPVKRWARVWSEEPTSRGLARLSSTPTADLPGGAADWLSEAHEPGEHLLVIGDAFEASLHAAEAGARAAWLERVEQEWIRPLVDALRHNAVATLSVAADTGLRVRATAADLRRWWRRRRDLATYLS